MKKLFVCIVIYKEPLEIIEKYLQDHREYLKKWYDKNILLVSGPKNPKNGGIVIGRFNNMKEAVLFSKNDPYVIYNVAKYDIIEFEAVLYNDLLDSFFN